jgi:hypothetical protein
MPPDPARFPPIKAIKPSIPLEMATFTQEIELVVWEEIALMTVYRFLPESKSLPILV